MKIEVLIVVTECNYFLGWMGTTVSEESAVSIFILPGKWRQQVPPNH
jgi:hypothetical protein